MIVFDRVQITSEDGEENIFLSFGNAMPAFSFSRVVEAVEAAESGWRSCDGSCSFGRRDAKIFSLTRIGHTTAAPPMPSHFHTWERRRRVGGGRVTTSVHSLTLPFGAANLITFGDVLVAVPSFQSAAFLQCQTASLAPPPSSLPPSFAPSLSNPAFNDANAVDLSECSGAGRRDEQAALHPSRQWA